MSDALTSSTVRSSSSSKDTAETTAETGVRVPPLRSTLKDIMVRPVSPNVVRDIIEREHYLHSMPAAPRCCFGVYLGEELFGAAVFTSGPRQGYRLLSSAKPQDVSVLARLWLSDILPPNSESRVIGVVLRHLRRNTGWKLILSYADPAAGHVGTIYQATGWSYLGQSEPNSYVDIGDGVARHPRSIYSRYGSNSIRHLRATGIPAKRCQAVGKHRYAYILDPHWAWRLRDKPQLYP